MPKSNSSTRKTTRQPALVTIAFQRTFVEGPFDGLTVNGLQRQVSRSIAKKLVTKGRGYGTDADGNLGVDRYIRVCNPDTDHEVLAYQELKLENALLTSCILNVMVAHDRRMDAIDRARAAV